MSRKFEKGRHSSQPLRQRRIKTYALERAKLVRKGLRFQERTPRETVPSPRKALIRSSKGAEGLPRKRTCVKRSSWTYGGLNRPLAGVQLNIAGCREKTIRGARYPEYGNEALT